MSLPVKRVLYFFMSLVKSAPSSTITMAENEQSILNGVVRILEHLIPKHKDDVCKIMMDMFKVGSTYKSVWSCSLVT